MAWLVVWFALAVLLVAVLIGSLRAAVAGARLGRRVRRLQTLARPEIARIQEQVAALSEAGQSAGAGGQRLSRRAATLQGSLRALAIVRAAVGEGFGPLQALRGTLRR